jgi:hypothetical protein
MLMIVVIALLERGSTHEEFFCSKMPWAFSMLLRTVRVAVDEKWVVMYFEIRIVYSLFGLIIDVVAC